MRAHLRHDLRVVDAALLGVVPQVRHPQREQPAAEGLVLRVLLEGAQVQVVAAAHEHAVDRHVAHRQHHLARLDREQEIAPGVERPLEQVAVLDHPALRVDQLAERLEERHRGERGGQRAEAPVGGDLPLARVDRHLRADGHRAAPVAPAHVPALDLHVPQHPPEVAPVGGEQRVEDLPVLVAELPVVEGVRRREVEPRLGVEPVEQ